MIFLDLSCKISLMLISGGNMRYIKYYFLTIFILVFISLNSINIKTTSNTFLKNSQLETHNIIQDANFTWPTPGYNKITSTFGKRNAPTKGASTSHSGIDIAAPTGSNILSVSDGIVTFLGFKGAGGFTLTVKNQDYTISYCHISPNFLVSIGDYVSKGSIISNVGPYNVYGVPNNPYKDSKGLPTNGASTGAHLHLTVKKNGSLINPLTLFSC